MDNSTSEHKVHIKTDFATVYLLNGTFSEKADGFSYPKNEPLYITVLPLSAHLLPYTVKIVGAKAIENAQLCVSFFKENFTYVKLLPRYNYVYMAKEASSMQVNSSTPERLFNAVRGKNFALAKKYLSQNLIETIDDAALEAFFDPYNAIVKDEFNKVELVAIGENYYLIDKDLNGTLFSFEIFDGLIDNITSE